MYNDWCGIQHLCTAGEPGYYMTAEQNTLSPAAVEAFRAHDAKRIENAKARGHQKLSSYKGENPEIRDEHGLRHFGGMKVPCTPAVNFMVTVNRRELAGIATSQ